MPAPLGPKTAVQPASGIFCAISNTKPVKALRAEPERRYASADSLATDLRRYLDGLLIAWRERGKLVAQLLGINQAQSGSVLQTQSPLQR